MFKRSWKRTYLTGSERRLLAMIRSSARERERKDREADREVGYFVRGDVQKWL